MHATRRPRCRRAGLSAVRGFSLGRLRYAKRATLRKIQSASPTSPRYAGNRRHFTHAKPLLQTARDSAAWTACRRVPATHVRFSRLFCNARLSALSVEPFGVLGALIDYGRIDSAVL